MNGGNPAAVSDRGFSSSRQSSTGRRVAMGRRRSMRRRLVLPSAVEALATDDIFRPWRTVTESDLTYDDSLEDVELLRAARLQPNWTAGTSRCQVDGSSKVTTTVGTARVQCPDAVRKAVDNCMCHLRLSSNHRYARGRDIAMVVGPGVIQGIAESWEQLERRLMAEK